MMPYTTFDYNSNIQTETKGNFFIILNFPDIGIEEYQLPPQCSIGYTFDPPYPSIAIKITKRGYTCYTPLTSPTIIADQVIWHYQNKKRLL